MFYKIIEKTKSYKVNMINFVKIQLHLKCPDLHALTLFSHKSILSMHPKNSELSWRERCTQIEIINNIVIIVCNQPLSCNADNLNLKQVNYHANNNNAISKHYDFSIYEIQIVGRTEFYPLYANISLALLSFEDDVCIFLIEREYKGGLLLI